MSDNLIERVDAALEGVETWDVFDDWVAAQVNRCTCSCITGYGHEPGCGYEPVGKVDEPILKLAVAARGLLPELRAEVEQLRAGGPWVEHVETVRALQQSHHGGCICDCNPGTTNGPEEYCSHHGRPYYEVVDRLTAKIEQLIQERLAFTDTLGFGDGVTEPAAELADIVDRIKEAFSEAREHNECPRLCEQCGEHRATTRCPECHGSGCNAPACEASGAYAECEHCAGVGWVHEGCGEASYTDLADEVKKLRGVIETVRNVAGHTAIGGWEHALLEILDLTVGIEKP